MSASLQELECASTRLRERAATPFQMPEWQTTWWKHFGSGELFVLTADDALLTCFRHIWQGKQQLTLLGSGISDYLDPIFHPALVRQAIDVDWEICDWQDLSAESPLLDPLLWPGLRVRIQPEVPVSSIPVVGSFRDFISARSKDLRRNLRRYRERASRSKPISFDIATEANPEIIDALINLHGERWRRRGEAGTIAQNRSEAFLRDVCDKMSQSGVLRLFVLRWGGEIAAVSVGFARKGRLYSYLSAFQPEAEILGFGRMLLHDSLEALWDGSFTAWDFLRGEEPYKASWGALFQSRVRLLVTRS